MNKFQPSPDELFTDPLDDLLASAIREAHRRDRTVRPSPTKDSRAEVLARPKLTSGFYLPDNWTHTRTISLIHQPSNTLLGNFKEYHYQKVTATRKLVRVEEPCATDGLETVTGDWWLQQATERRTDPKSWIESRQVIIDIALAECGLYCDAATVQVRLEHGWIARVELTSDTRFTCAARNTFLILSAGLDVLEAMSVESRIALKESLHVGEEGE